MKLEKLQRHLRRYGCHLARQGARHSIWINPANGESTARDIVKLMTGWWLRSAGTWTCRHRKSSRIGQQPRTWKPGMPELTTVGRG